MNKNITEIFALLSVPTRLKILYFVASHKEVCAKDILPVLNVTQPTLSHHMNELVEGGVLKATKSGRCIYYSVNPSMLDDMEVFLSSIKNPTDITPVETKRAVKAPVKKVVTETVSETDSDSKKIKKNKDKDSKDKEKDKKKKKEKKKKK